MADVTLDLFEYSSDALAQAAYQCGYRNVVPTMIANRTPEGVASCDVANDLTRIAFRAFDKSNVNANVDCWHSDNSAYPHWVKYEFEEAKIITKYVVFARVTYNDHPTDWKLQGSNDDSSWTDLDTQSSANPSISGTAYTFSNTTAYKYYRLYCTAGNNGNYCIVGELELWEWQDDYIHVYSETTIKEEGSYALKCVATTGALNKSIVRNIRSTVDLFPDMTSNTAPSGTVSASSIWDANYDAYKALDDNTGTCWHTSTGGTTWIKYEFPAAIVADGYSIAPRGGGSTDHIIDWKLQGSNNDADWTDLDEQIDQNFVEDVTPNYYYFVNKTAYKYYRLLITESNNNNHGIVSEWQLFKSSIDLSGCASVTFRIRSSRTGSNIKVGIKDSGGTITEVTPDISSADTWQTGTIDLSGVQDANKDTICQIIITCVNADSANTFYLDNMVGVDAADIEVSATCDALTLTENAATVTVATVVNTLTDSLTLTEYAAGINAEVNIPVGVDELTLTEFAADVSLGISVAATCDSLTLTENQAFIQADTNIAATCDALSLSEYDAIVNASINISSTCSTLTLTEQTADVNLNVSVSATCGALSLAENAAEISYDINIATACSSLTLTEQSADVNLNVVVKASYDYLSINSFYAVITNLPHNVVATDWLKYKGECHAWIDSFQEQQDKFGYRNNPTWGDQEEEDRSIPVNPVWTMKNRRF